MKTRPILFSGPMVRALLAGSKTQTRRIAKPQPRVNDNGSWRWDTGRSYGWTGSSGTHWPPTQEVFSVLCPYGEPGELLIVREAHHLTNTDAVIYRANWREDSAARGFDNIPEDEASIRWRPSIHMHRRNSRLTLEIADVRIERLQEISDADARAEGIVYGPADRHGGYDPRWIMGRCRDCQHWNTNLGPNGGKRVSCPYHFSDRVDPQPVYGDAGQGCSTSFSVADGDDETATFQFRHFWDRINGASPSGHWNANPWVWAVSFKVHRQNVDAFLAGRAA